MSWSGQHERRREVGSDLHLQESFTPPVRRLARARDGWLAPSTLMPNPTINL